MALQGKYNFKGIELAEAYVKINHVNYYSSQFSNEVVKTPEVLNEDGTVKTPAEFETVVTKTDKANYSASVYSSKSERDTNYNNIIDTIHGEFDMKVTNTAKNGVIQAYEAVKALEDYKDYTDV